MSEKTDAKTVEMTINGRTGTFPAGMTILEAARHVGIHIPTLCYSEAVSQYGSCRLCVVEVSRRGRKRYVISCMHPVGSFEVRTDCPEVLEARRSILEFLLARSPNSPELKALYRQYARDAQPPYSIVGVHGESNCILCGLCVRACAEVVGASAVGFANRGIRKKVTPGLFRCSDVCIGCGTCVFVCPTDAIRVEEVNSVHMAHEWNQESDRRHCRVCGTVHVKPEFFEDLTALTPRSEG